MNGHESTATESARFDTVIVGAGVIGLALAYELSSSGERVCVLDREAPAGQASWAAAGILPPADQHAAHDEFEQLRGLSHRLFPEWAERLLRQTNVDTGYRRCGGLHVARGAGEAAALRAAAALWRADGVEARQVGTAEIAILEPELRETVAAGKLRAVFHVPGEAQVRSPDFLQALLHACRQNHVQIRAHEQIDRWDVSHNEVRAIHAREHRFPADKFCIAAGPWSAGLLRHFGLQVELRPWRGQIVLFDASCVSLRHVINEGPNYLVPRDDGRVLVGSTVEDVGFDRSTTETAKRELVAFAHDLVPRLKTARVQRVWSGLRPGSGDGFPYLGNVTGFHNLYVASGHYRSGIHLAPATAVVMSQLMLGEHPSVSLSAFRMDRE